MSTDRETGRAAAEWVVHHWRNRHEVEEIDSADFGAAAIERLAEHIEAQPELFQASVEGAHKGAETLSAQKFQGILESLQNADDLGAGQLRLGIRTNGSSRELLIAHDGSPVVLANVAAMVLPFVTTKADDPSKSGRFGIGQMTLGALGGPIEMHCRPYHFRIFGQVPVVVPPQPSVANVYDMIARETLLLVPLHDDVGITELERFGCELGSQSLVFMRSIRRLSLFDVASDQMLFEHSLHHRGQRTAQADIQGRAVTAAVDYLEDKARQQHYTRFVVEMPVGGDTRRQHKATGPTTTLGVAIPRSPETGLLYDRVPIPAPSHFAVGMNAQFDPDTSRSTLLDTDWNARRFDELGELLAVAALDLCVHEPKLAWTAMPLQDEVPEALSDFLTERYSDGVIATAQRRLASELQLGTPKVPLDEIVYETESLDGILTLDDQSYLLSDYMTVPLKDRDAAGRWRWVLDDLDCSVVIGVDHAVEILDQSDEELGERQAKWYVDFAAAAEDADWLPWFCERRGVLLADGTRVRPPGPDEPRSLVIQNDPASLAARLGAVLRIHPSYLAEDGTAEAVREALEREGFLATAYESDVDGLRLLGRGVGDPIRLQDDSFLALCEAFERLTDKEQRTLGTSIGAAIELRGFSYENGVRTEDWVSPAAAYLPAKIERIKASFEHAAAGTSGIDWLDAGYDKLLKRGGRRVMGAQRMLGLLGAQTYPRLIAPPDEYVRYKRDPRKVTDVGLHFRTTLQANEIRAQSDFAEYLMEDRHSPDLDAVIADIIADSPAEVRRERATALLGVIARGWAGHFAEHTTAKVVWWLSTYFDEIGPVISTWLARAVTEPWLPSGTGALRPPCELHLPSEANRVTLGNKQSQYLMAVDEQVLRSPALVGLRLRNSQSADMMVARLESLRDSGQQLTAAERDEVATIYRVLALQCLGGDDQPVTRGTVDDLTVETLRSRFNGGRTTPGLIFTNGWWYEPGELFRGPRIFGSHRVFTPGGSALEPLWGTLEVAQPGARDCIDVLAELKQHPLARDDVAVVIESLLIVADDLEKLAKKPRKALKALPLWNGSRWCTHRPIYAVDDDSVADALRLKNDVWKPGFRIDGLRQLLDALGVTYVAPEQFEPVASGASGAADSMTMRRRFVVAVEHLRTELARNDQALSKSLKLPWEELGTAAFVIDDELRVVALGQGGDRLEAPTLAHLARNPLVLYARSWEDVGSDEAGGRAIAELFSGDRQKVAWAWPAMWHRAQGGGMSERIVLSSDVSDHGEFGTDLTQLKLQTDTRQKRGRRAALRQPEANAKSSTVVARPLKDLEALEPVAGRVVNQGAVRGGVAVPSTSELKPPARKRDKRSGDALEPPEPVEVLPPMNAREQLAYDAVVRALSLDDVDVNDLRQQRGVGADAVDELRQYYEVKMSSGAEFPKEITLTANEVKRAREPKFFLAVVAGLEQGSGQLRVRFIADPLRQLYWRMNRSGFDAASFFEKDADYVEALPDRSA